MQPKCRYYVDEDTWETVLADHWDANDRLWQTAFSTPMVMPDLPATTSPQNSGFYDLISGAAFFAGLQNEEGQHFKSVAHYPATNFTPEALSGEGAR